MAGGVSRPRPCEARRWSPDAGAPLGARWAKSVAALLAAIPVALANIYLYDQLFGLPGTSTIPTSWLQLALSLVIPAILLGHWLLGQYYERRYG